MKLQINFIRGGAPGGGDERFLGKLNKPLAESEKINLAKKACAGEYPPAQMVFSSGLSRCFEAAQVIYPALPVIILPELAPFDYGEFTGLTYSEIFSDKRFAQFSNPGFTPSPPGGEGSVHIFLARCSAAIKKIAREGERKNAESVSVVTHRMVIAAILSRYCAPRPLYRDWKINYGGGYACSYDIPRCLLEIITNF